jgi:hypothetical protein
LRGKHSLEVEEELKQGPLKVEKRKKNIPAVKVEEEEMELVEAEDSEEERECMKLLVITMV